MNPVFYHGKEICPSKIVCAGRNYVAHANELNNEVPEEPVIFIKPNSAIGSQPVAMPDEVLHYEAEISFLVVAERLSGVGFGLDLTKRVLQTELKSRGLPWERAKSFDNSAVFSEFVEFTGDMNSLRLVFYINDKLVQQGGSQQMLHKPTQLLTECQHFLSFEDGDILMTGTPAGVGPVIAGDHYRGRIIAGDKVLIDTSWVVK